MVLEKDQEQKGFERERKKGGGGLRLRDGYRLQELRNCRVSAVKLNDGPYPDKMAMLLPVWMRFRGSCSSLTKTATIRFDVFGFTFV